MVSRVVQMAVWQHQESEPVILHSGIVSIYQSLVAISSG